MFGWMKGKTVPVLLFSALLVMGLFAAGCEGPAEDMWTPEEEPEEVEDVQDW